MGPLRRLSRRLLAHSLHASESRATASAASELKEMLKEASGPAELAAIRAELAAVERGTFLGGRGLCLSLPHSGRHASQWFSSLLLFAIRN